MRILVVEDEPKVARALTRGLRFEGYAVDLVGSGDDALVHLRTHEYDAVILDVMLPGPDGFAVCRAMRANGVWAPVLMLTARDQLDDRISGLDAGADDYLVKPFAFSELVARVRALVRRGAIPRPATVTIADLVLDPAARTVSRDGVDIALTAREFSVLEFLTRRPGEVVTRTQLLEHVWEYHFAGESNVVDVYVARLRRKLDRSEESIIQTVRGAGYMLRAP